MEIRCVYKFRREARNVEMRSRLEILTATYLSEMKIDHAQGERGE